MKKLKLLLSGMMLLTTLSGFAVGGDRGGNGGDGIYIDDKLYLLDFVEAGIEQSPLIPDYVTPSLLTKLRVDMLFPQEGMPRALIAKKITELREGTFPFFGTLLLNVMELYQWRLVNSKLIDIKDENTVLQYEKLEQLAIRKNSTIMIDRALWEKLDEANKVGLIFHEAIYALIKPRVVDGKMQQLSDRARELTGKLFTDNYWMGLGTILEEDFDEDMNLVIGGDLAISVSTMTGTLYSPKLVIYFENDSDRTLELSFGKNDPYDWKMSDIAQSICHRAKKTERLIIRDEANLKAVELAEFESEGVLRKYAKMTNGLDGATYNLNTRNVITVSPGEGCQERVVSNLNDVLEAVKKKYMNAEDEVCEE
jgi:hypothetical protein